MEHDQAVQVAGARAGRALFFAGVALMLVSALVGRSVQPALTEVGLASFSDTGDGSEALSFFVFALGFPVGLCACLAGVVLCGGERWTRASLFAALALPGVGVVTVFPALVGRHPSPAYFGLGGLCILALVSVVVWCWGANRSRQSPGRRAALDLQMIGYLCFAVAAWNVCGFASVPALALFPEKVIELGTGPFAIGQLKAVMALFVLGWLFTALGFRRAMVDAGTSTREERR